MLQTNKSRVVVAIVAVLVGMLVLFGGAVPKPSPFAAPLPTPTVQYGGEVEGVSIPEPQMGLKYPRPDCYLPSNRFEFEQVADYVTSLTWEEAITFGGITGIRDCAPDQRSLLVNYKTGKVLGIYEGRMDCSFWAATWAVRAATKDSGFDLLYVDLHSAETQAWLNAHPDKQKEVASAPWLPNVCAQFVTP